MDQALEDLSLRSFGANIWTLDGDDVQMFGVLPFTTRMTIIKLATGGLWLHSPVAPTLQRRRAIDRLGPVKHLVAPNKIHSLGIEPWRTLYPAARVWTSPEFPKRHPDIAVDELLTNDIAASWRSEIDLCVIEGHAFLDEVAFIHKPSKSLIITDLIQKHDAEKDIWLWRGVKRMVGVLGEDGGTSLDIKLSIRDKRAMRRSIEHMLSWDFDNLIIAHGHCLRGGARKEVERALKWITRHT